MRVHNLQGIDLDLPLGKLIVLTGVSGAGKSSLAFDTLYAEGQRRYVESFPTYSRQFLERLEQPAADSIGRIPPAIAVRQTMPGGSRRATLASATEVLDYLRLLFARAGEIVCPTCRRPVIRHSPASVARLLAATTTSGRLQIGFPIVTRAMAESTTDDDLLRHLSHLTHAGFSRAVVGDATRPLSEITPAMIRAAAVTLIIVDRLTTPIASSERLTDSLETAFREGGGSCVVLQEASAAHDMDASASAVPPKIAVDGRDWSMTGYDEGLVCGTCQREFPTPEPAHFSFQSPLGACPVCRGLGVVDPVAAIDSAPRGRRTGGTKSAIVEGQVVCPECHGTRLQPFALAVEFAGHSLPAVTAMTVDEALAFATRFSPTRIPPSPLAGGGPGWGGQMSRGSTEEITADALNVHFRLIPPIVRRLELLRNVGLGYLTLDRPLRTLSRGEAQRARLAGACGSNLVNLLYVLDEPTTGLHPRDTERLLDVLLSLRDAGNTVVAVEHDPAVIARADHIVDLGPQAGHAGGRVVYQGPPAGVVNSPESVTGDFIAGRRLVSATRRGDRREPSGWLHLSDVNHHNLRGVSVAFPLGVLCVVSGVSGSGKSSLVLDVLLPAVERALRVRTQGEGEGETRSEGVRETRRTASSTPQLPHSPTPPLTYSALTGTEQLENVVYLDAAPIGRSPRSQPASFLGIFGEIRTLFAGTAEAKVQNLTARHFSFNAAGGGRCETCAGSGSVAVDMQFLPDVVVTCADCHGTRYRREILDVKYRGLSIAEVLALTARDAFTFFRGRTRIQRRLKYLKEAGLEYLSLGQPARTLSGGESQRLKLAAFLSQGTRARTLIVLEEPTTGLHPQDVGRLLDCWNTLLAAGHSLIVIEHNLDVIRSADYVIDLGPEAGAAGGRVVAEGPPAEIAGEPASITGRFLAARELEASR